MASHIHKPSIDRSHNKQDPQGHIVIYQGQRDGSVRRRVCTVADLATARRSQRSKESGSPPRSRRRAPDERS
jgi:hypothetical protein